MGNKKSKKPYDLNYCIYLNKSFECNNKNIKAITCPYKDKVPIFFCDGYVEKDLDGN